MKLIRMIFYSFAYLFSFLLHLITFGYAKKLPPPFFVSKPDTLDHKMLDQLRREGRLDEAYAILDQHIFHEPDNPHPLNKKAMFLVYQGKNEEALELLDRAISVYPLNDAAFNNKSWALHNMGRYAESLTNINTAINISGGTSIEYTNKGNALMGLNRFSEAEEAYQQAIDTDVTNFHAWSRLGQLYEKQEKYEQALKPFSKCLALNPAHSDTYYALAQCYEKAGHSEESLRIYERWEQVDKNNYLIPLKKGQLLLEMERNDEALAHYRAAHEQFPHDDDIRFGLGKVLCRLNQADEAVDHLIAAARWDDNYMQDILNDPVFSEAANSERFMAYVHGLSSHHEAEEPSAEEGELAGNERIELGSFTCKSGILIVSDPCYDLGVWCSGAIENAATGTWNAVVDKVDTGDSGMRCSALLVTHESCVNPDDLEWKSCEFIVGVDSGQAGIFDHDVYKQDDTVEGITLFMPEDKWYSSCCDLTIGEIGAGVINGGAVSSSGFGDGAYKAYMAQDDDGQVIGATIVFLTEQDLQEKEEPEVEMELAEN
ncbi:MAG: tetratricopeptide repeat protein [Clostridia bacterium]